MNDLGKYLNKITCGDCLELMPELPDKSIDMILCDLPYGTTACNWDVVIPFEPLWEQYKRIAKDNAAIVLFGSQPFTTDLINSNRVWFRYEWIWNKRIGANFLNAKIRPIMIHENILIFSKSQASNGAKNLIKYNPIMEKGKIRKEKINKRFKARNPKYHHLHERGAETKYYDEYYPKTIIDIIRDTNNNRHATQKPVSLFAYLIKTYSNEGDIILDNCSGSGTTAEVCIKTNRNFICFEINEDDVKKSRERIRPYQEEMKLPLEDEKPEPILEQGRIFT